MQITGILKFLLSVITVVIGGGTSIGLASYYLKISRNEEVKFGELFAHMNELKRGLKANLVRMGWNYLYIVGFTLLGYVVMSVLHLIFRTGVLEILGMAIGSVLFIAATITGLVLNIKKQLSYALVQYILADNPDMNAKEALQKSEELMAGHKSELFMFQFSYIGWILLGYLVCGVGVFIILPYIETGYAEFYNEISEYYYE